VYELPPISQPARLSIGCSSQCDIQINDTSISRIHAYIEVKNGHYIISDANSLSGTSINKKQIKPNEQIVLFSNDLINIGYINIVFLGPIQFYRMVCGFFLEQ